MLRIFAALLALLFPASIVTAQQTGSIRGRIETAGGRAIAQATVTIIETSASARTSSAGEFSFSNLQPGTYNLLIESSRVGAHSRSVDVAAGEEATPIISIDIGVHSEEIVVTASPDARRVSEVYQPIAALNEQELLERAEASLGETLSKEPGVSSTYFGPGSSRPVIRGLGGDRIRVLEEGIGAGDASNVSPDHAVTSDPLTASRIEIVRGPATLLYGSAAVGGVVNLIDDRIPDALPTQDVTGQINLIVGSVANEVSGGVTLGGAVDSIAWHLGYTDRSMDDYEIPESGGDHEDEGEPSGVLENSSLDTSSGAAGLSWILPRGFAGFSVARFATNYGIPGAHGHGEEHDDDEEHSESESVRIDMTQTRYDFRGRLDLGGIVENIKLRAGLTDYEHVELEGDEIGTTFENDGWEARIEAVHRPIGPVRGAIGAQVSRRDFVAVGEEAFVPANQTETAALFIFEELSRGPLSYQGGLRWERQNVTADSPDLPARSFDGVSASAGAVWNRASSPVSLGVSVARTERLPTAEELYSNGPHIATNSFEVGDPLLNPETAFSIDATARGSWDRFRGEVSVFRNGFSDFIYLAPTDEMDDDLRVFRYEQRDATFHGVELEGHFELYHSEPHHVELDMGADTVRGNLEGGGDLPRITPARVFVGVQYEGDALFGDVELRHTLEQDRVATFEEPTGAYTLLNANVGYRFLWGEISHLLLIRGRNLTNELARSHVSPLKDVAPLPGRDFSLAWRVLF